MDLFLTGHADDRGTSDFPARGRMVGHADRMAQRIPGLRLSLIAEGEQEQPFDHQTPVT
jgi:hypothetical protein